jgi:hypothetical protein
VRPDRGSGTRPRQRAVVSAMKEWVEPELTRAVVSELARTVDSCRVALVLIPVIAVCEILTSSSDVLPSYPSTSSSSWK